MPKLLCILLIWIVFTTACQTASAAPFWKAARLGGGLRTSIAGLDVVVWEPARPILNRSVFGDAASPAPLVIFSHGFHGGNGLSVFLMKALAQEGYLVIAPNHRDSISNGLAKKQLQFNRPELWSENTYRDREQDIKQIICALHADADWSARIDWSKLALVGHSLGGYTVLGLAGAWPSWKLPGVKAVVALAPYTNPFLKRETLNAIDVPVMYQCGTRDVWINMFVKGRNGAFTKTPPPAVYVEFDNANHYAWTNLNTNSQRKDLVCHYSIEFLNKYVRGDSAANPQAKLAGVNTLQSK